MNGLSPWMVQIAMLPVRRPKPIEPKKPVDPVLRQRALKIAAAKAEKREIASHGFCATAPGAA